MSTIVYNLKRVTERLKSAAEKGERDPKEITLVAVTKGIDVAKIREGIGAGIKIVGENRVQEGLSKIEELKEIVSWHMIGHLQTNKVKDVVGRFELIHSVDSVSLAREIDKRAKGKGIVQRLLLQVNISREESKYGLYEEDIIKDIDKISGLENISVIGLMTIPPYSIDPEDSRVYFCKLRRLFQKIRDKRINNISMEELSMGMSNDFEVAIQEGATMVRIGTAIFGPREERR